jgi:hypothetical protein
MSVDHRADRCRIQLMDGSGKQSDETIYERKNQRQENKFLYLGNKTNMFERVYSRESVYKRRHLCKGLAPRKKSFHTHTLSIHFFIFFSSQHNPIHTNRLHHGLLYIDATFVRKGMGGTFRLAFVKFALLKQGSPIYSLSSMK